MGDNTPPPKFEIISPVFRDGTPIPPQYTCAGQNVNPPVNIFHPPAKTQSLVLVVHDPDASGGDYLHWLVWDIPPGTESIPVNSVPIGARQGLNDSGKNGYSGPCPPPGSGTHQYIFDIYAVDSVLGLKPKPSVHGVMKAIDGHILARSVLIGTASAKAS